MIQPKRCQLRQHLWACARQWDRGQNPSVLPRSEKIPECAPCSLPGLGCLLPAVRLSSLCASRLSRPHLCPSIHKWHQVQSHARWSRVCVWSAASPQSTVSVGVMSAAGTLISPVEMVVMLVRTGQCQLMGCPPCWCKPLACQLLRSEFIFIDMGPHCVAHVGPKLMILLPQP